MSAFIIFSFTFCNYPAINAMFYISAIFFVFSKVDLKKTLFSKESILIAITLLYFTITLLWSAYSYDFMKYMRYSICILIFILILHTLYHKNRIFLLYSILIASTISSLVALFSISHFSQLSTIRLPAPYGPENVIDFAGYCSIGFLVSTYLLLQSKSKSSFLTYIFIALINLAACLLTQSRGPILYTAICSLFLIRKNNLKNAGKFILCLMTLAIIVHTANIINLSTLISRFLAINTEINGTEGFRGAIWKFALNRAFSSPIIGHGILTPLNYPSPSGIFFTTTHSVYFGSFFTGGLIGLLLFLSMCGFILFNSIKNYTQDSLALALFSFALLHISSQWKFLIMSPDAPWFIFWMPLALSLSQITSRRK
ncbi:MAG: O-antigen ligase family protein [Plesiomonas sp.]